MRRRLGPALNTAPEALFSHLVYDASSNETIETISVRRFNGRYRQPLEYRTLLKRKRKMTDNIDSSTHLVDGKGEWKDHIPNRLYFGSDNSYKNRTDFS